MIDLDVSFAGDDAILPADQYRALKAVAEAANIYRLANHANARRSSGLTLREARARLFAAIEALSALKDA